MFSWPPPMKKTMYYNFFPTKEEEERGQGRSSTGEVDRVVVEIRDTAPPPVVDLNDPWVIKKTLRQNEIVSEKLVLMLDETLKHVLHYWSLNQANAIVVGGMRVGVTIWDVTQENSPKKYDEMDGAHMQGKGADFYVACGPLIKDRNLKVDDEIGLCWDYTRSCFMFTLFAT